MAGERLETSEGGFVFIWNRCCCGVKCYAGLNSGPSQYIGEYEFVESIEETARRSQGAALDRAKEVMR